MDTKEQILQESLKLFSKHSYHGASIRDIAKNIGKRESSIYNHFKSKEEILSKIIEKFSSRNFGQLILTDELVNKISKPQKFFEMLSTNLFQFWNSEDERMFIRVLLSGLLPNIKYQEYTIENYISDFEGLCKFILREMMNHKFIKKMDVSVVSKEFISPLFLFQIGMILGNKAKREQNAFVKLHSDYFWEFVKR